MIPPQSPSLLVPPQQRAANVRRLNWVPMAAVMVVIAIALGAIGYTLYHKNQQAKVVAEQETQAGKIHGSQAPTSLSAAAAANATINSPALSVKTPPPPTAGPAAPTATPGAAGQPGPSTPPNQLKTKPAYKPGKSTGKAAHSRCKRITSSSSKPTAAAWTP